MDAHAFPLSLSATLENSADDTISLQIARSASLFALDTNEPLTVIEQWASPRQ
jgi:hypothetical protein